MSRLIEVCRVSETVSAIVKHEQKQFSPINDWFPVDQHSLPSPGVLSPPSSVSPTSTLPRDLEEPLLPPPLPVLSSFAPPVAPGASAPPTLTVITGNWNWILIDSNSGAMIQPEHQSLVTTLSDGSLAALSPGVWESSPSPAPLSAPLVSSGTPAEPHGSSASSSSAAAASRPAPFHEDEQGSAFKLLTRWDILNRNVTPVHLLHESLSGSSLFLPLCLLLLPHLLRLVPKSDESPPFCFGADSEDGSQTWRNLGAHLCRWSNSASLSRSSWSCCSITCFIQATSATALSLREFFLLSSSPSPSSKAASILRSASCSAQKNLTSAWVTGLKELRKWSYQTNQLLLHLLGSSPHLSAILPEQETSGGTNAVRAALYQSTGAGSHASALSPHFKLLLPLFRPFPFLLYLLQLPLLDQQSLLLLLQMSCLRANIWVFSIIRRQRNGFFQSLHTSSSLSFSSSICFWRSSILVCSSAFLFSSACFILSRASFRVLSYSFSKRCSSSCSDTCCCMFGKAGSLSGRYRGCKHDEGSWYVLDGMPTVTSVFYLFLFQYLLLPLTDNMIFVQLRLNLQAQSKWADEKKQTRYFKDGIMHRFISQRSWKLCYLSQLWVVFPPMLPQQLFCQLGITSRCGLLLSPKSTSLLFRGQGETAHLFSPFLARCAQLLSFLQELTPQCAPIRYQLLELCLQSVLLLLKQSPEHIPALLQISLLLFF